jgi:acetylornithine deacetylase/succinyl-diaminopimelate desuccinylase-like protein
MDLRTAAHERMGYATELLGRLVSEPSVVGSDAAIERCLDVVETEVGRLAVEVIRPEHDGLTSLVARFGPSARGRALAFSGHVDVVPAEGRWRTPPFELAHEDGRYRGRGVCDMKAGVAAFVAAVRALADARALDDCSLELVLTGDEEVGSRRGMIPLLREGLITAGAAVCGEPTGLHVFLGNRGVIWMEVRIRGRGGHAGLVHTLANPIEPAVALAQELRLVPLDARDERFEPPTASLTVTRIDAGAGAANIVPDEAVLGIDRRLLPDESVEGAQQQVREAARRTIGREFEHEVAVLREWPPYSISDDQPIARVACAAVRDAGRRVELGMDLAANDSSWLDQAGVPTVLLGPGDPEEAHTTDEELSADQLRDAILVYAHMARGMRQAVS